MRTRLSVLIACTTVVIGMLAFAPSASAVACNFQNAMSGNWNVDTNWDCGVVPGATDTVTIDGGETVTVTGAQSAQSITIPNGNIAFSGGSVTAGSASISTSNMTGPSSLTGFTVTGATAKTTSGTWLVRGGPHVVLGGAVTHSGGQLCIDDVFGTGNDPVVDANSTYTMSGDASIACSSNLGAAGFRVNAPNGQLVIADDTTISTPIENADTVSEIGRAHV